MSSPASGWAPTPSITRSPVLDRQCLWRFPAGHPRQRQISTVLNPDTNGYGSSYAVLCPGRLESNSAADHQLRAALGIPSDVPGPLTTTPRISCPTTHPFRTARQSTGPWWFRTRACHWSIPAFAQSIAPMPDPHRDAGRHPAEPALFAEDGLRAAHRLCLARYRGWQDCHPRRLRQVHRSAAGQPAALRPGPWKPATSPRFTNSITNGKPRSTLPLPVPV